MSTDQDNFAGMKPVARFVIRPELDPEHQKSWLILGMTTTINQTLKHGGVYEIRECEGELSVVHVGETAIGPAMASQEDRIKTPWLLSWALTADELISGAGKLLTLTISEWRAYLASKGSNL